MCVCANSTTTSKVILALSPDQVNEKVQAQREAQAKSRVLGDDGQEPGTPTICRRSAAMMSSRMPASEVHAQLYADASARRQRHDEAVESQRNAPPLEVSGLGGPLEAPKKAKDQKVYSDCVSSRLHHNGVMNAINSREKVTKYETECGRNTNFNERRGTAGEGPWQAMSMRTWERSLK